jgi:hypothetical protein
MDETPKKRRTRSDKGKRRAATQADWRATIYLSRSKYPAKAIVQKLEDHFKEFPGDNPSKLFEREMAGILQLPLTQEMTLADLIDRMVILSEEYEVKIEALDKRLERLDRLIGRLESGGMTFASDRRAAQPSEPQDTQRSEEGAAYLGNMFGGMKSRQSRKQQ